MSGRAELLDMLTERVDAEWPPNRNRRWRPEHDRRIVRDYRIVGAKALARELGRTVHAVQNRASMLGVASGLCGRGRCWTEGEDAIVRRTVDKLAQVLGRDTGAVGARCNRIASIATRAATPGKD